MTAAPPRTIPQAREGGFTPGPWHVVLSDNYPRIGIATVYGVTNQPTEDGLGQHWIYIAANVSSNWEEWRVASDEERLANAHLMAAAPAMFAALSDMLAGWRYIRANHGDLYGVGWDRAQQAADAALTSAGPDGGRGAPDGGEG